MCVPRVRENAVWRQRIHAQLDAAANKPLTVVSAAAGFGKTTLVAEWLSRPGRAGHVAWLGIEDEDSEPQRLLRDIIASLQQVVPAAGESILSLLTATSNAPMRRLVGDLGADLSGWSHPVWLVLDDYHAADSDGAAALLTQLVEEMPPTLRIVLITRHEPPLPLARWRTQERLAEIDQADLQFTPDEAAAFFGGTMGLALQPGSVQRLAQRTEGWIAGLQMAALSLQRGARDEGGAALDSHVEGFGARHRYVMDYLAGEVLHAQGEEVHAFLRQTSILESLSTPLCNAVTGRDDAEDLLAQLDRLNLFVVRLDDERRQYRYHALFADFLRSRLAPGEAAVLHQRASAWYLRNGHLAEAFRHGRAAQDVPACIDIVRRSFDTLLGHGDSTTLLGWLEALPPAAIEAHRDVAGMKAWLLYLRGRTQEARELARAALADPDDPLLAAGAMLAFRAYLALNWDGDGEAETLAQRALEALPDGALFLRLLALSYLGQSQAANGRRALAIATFDQALHVGTVLRTHISSLGALVHLAELMCAQGRMAEARRITEDVLGRQHDAHGRPTPLAGFARIALGELQLEANELEAARDSLAQGLALVEPAGIVYFTLMGQCRLAKTLHALGRRDEAWATLNGARALAQGTGSARRRRLVDAMVAELQWREGDAEAAMHTLAAVGSVWPHAATEHELLLHARLLGRQGRSTEALQLLSMAEAGARRDGFERSLAEILLITALAQVRDGHLDAARQAGLEAVRLAAPQRYLRLFLDEGAELLPLAEQLHGAAPAFVGEITAALRGAEAPASAELTPRELSLLQLLNRGFQNKEIAAELNVTVGTTKQYINRLFSKLGARNRVEAILAGRRLNLLP